MPPISIALSGLPGKMCREIALLVQEPAYQGRFTLLPTGFTSSSRSGSVEELGPARIELRSLSELAALPTEARPIIIDYTTPDAALANIEAYIGAGIPFVMGTTGFERAEAVRLVSYSTVSAVIAPNMAAPIVLIQTALADLAKRFPGALADYKLRIQESHQSAKKDISGTARALHVQFTALGAVAAKTPAIDAIRDPEIQREIGVPAAYLGGHGWHTYHLQSPAEDVHLALTHNVNGRRVYAEGTLLAVEFLARKIAAGSVGQVFSMTEVLEGA